MRLGAWVLAALFVGAFSAHFLLQDRGYVLINFRSYVVEMSVPALVLALCLAYALLRGLVNVWRAPRSLGRAFTDWQLRRAGGNLTRGLMHMTEGDWRRGERLLTQGLKGSDAPLVNYLMAARAAQLQGSTDRRDEWLKIAYEELPEAETTVLLTQAQLQFEDEEYELALAALERIREKQPDHPAGLALLARCYRALGDRRRLVELLPRLARVGLRSGELEDFVAEGLEALLSADELSYDQVERIWGALPAATRRLPRLLRLRALALEQLDRGAQAEKELRTALRRHWHPSTVRAYGEVTGADRMRQLRQAESWLNAHPEDPALLFTAARLCIRNELWGKARSYLESGLALGPEPEAYAIYGELLNRLGERDQAALAYQSGLRMVSGAEPGLPVLDAPPAGAARPAADGKELAAD